MIIDIAKALLFAGIPVALFSYYLIKITLKTTPLTANNATELKKELKEATLDDKDDTGIAVKILRQ